MSSLPVPTAYHLTSSELDRPSSQLYPVRISVIRLLSWVCLLQAPYATLTLTDVLR